MPKQKKSENNCRPPVNKGYSADLSEIESPRNDVNSLDTPKEKSSLDLQGILYNYVLIIAKHLVTCIL